MLAVKGTRTGVGDVLLLVVDRRQDVVASGFAGVPGRAPRELRTPAEAGQHGGELLLAAAAQGVLGLGFETPRAPTACGYLLEGGCHGDMLPILAT